MSLQGLTPHSHDHLPNYGLAPEEDIGHLPGVNLQTYDREIWASSGLNPSTLFPGTLPGILPHPVGIHGNFPVPAAIPSIDQVPENPHSLNRSYSNHDRIPGHHMEMLEDSSLDTYGNRIQGLHHGNGTDASYADFHLGMLDFVRLDRPNEELFPAHQYGAQVVNQGYMTANQRRQEAIPCVAQTLRINTRGVTIYDDLSIPVSTSAPSHSSSTPISSQHESADVSSMSDLPSPQAPSLPGEQSSSNTPAECTICPFCRNVTSQATDKKTRSSNHRRHIREKHEGAGHSCPVSGCQVTFQRSDYVQRHLQRCHGHRRISRQ